MINLHSTIAAPPARARAEHPLDTTPEMKPWCSATRRRPELPPFPRQVAIATVIYYSLEI